MRHLPRTTTRTIGAFVVAALLATGCGDDEVEADTASTTSEPVALEDAGTDAGTDATTTEDEITDADATDADGPVVDDEREPMLSDQASPPPVAQTGDPIISVEGSDAFPQLDLLDLRRDGDTVTLEFAVHVEQRDSRKVRINESFSSIEDTSSVLAKSDPDVNQFLNPKLHSVSGVTLVDRENSNRHLVLRDATGACLCTRFEKEDVATGVYRHSAQFPAPPAGVTSMTVEVPNFPSIDGVAIREAN